MSPPLRVAAFTAVAIGALVCLPGLRGIPPVGAVAPTQAGAAGGQANTGAQGITPEGEKVEVPDSDGCFIYVTAWENGSWLHPNSPPGRRRLQWGTTQDTTQSKRDVEEIKRWLEILLASSSDMREKAQAACKLTGVKWIQVAIVRDDAKTGPGTAFPGTPLVLIDMGDAEKLAKSGRTSGTQNASLENSARMTLEAYLPVTLIVHEIDHMRRPPREWAMFSPETMEGFAMDDENRVAVQLENFRPHKTDIGIWVRRLERTRYSPVLYTYRPSVDIPIRIELDAAGAGIVFEHREPGHEPRFTELSDDDDAALAGMGAGRGVEEFDADLDGIGNPHDNCPHAGNPQQRDHDDDGTGDDCDPEVTETRQLTQAFVDDVLGRLDRAAATAGVAPQLALIGPDIAGGIRFVRLAEVWPLADPFGIFRSPGIGDRYLDAWLRIGMAVRLSLLGLFSDPLGVLSLVGTGTAFQDANQSAVLDRSVQVFAARVAAFSSGSPFAQTLIIPVLVPPAPLAERMRPPWVATRAPEPTRLLELQPAFSPFRRGRWVAARNQDSAPRTSSPKVAARPSLKVFFVSLGRTSGSAFRMTVVNDGNVPVWLMLNTFALKPLANVTSADVERQLAPFTGRGRVTMDIDGYCLEFPKRPPPAGMVFGLADADLQAAMAPIDRITQAVGRLQKRGALKPDTEDETEYAHDMVQWSIWTHREGFDEPRFTRAFVEHVRKNFVAAGDRWTRETERAVAALAPARWRQIQAILRESAT